MRKCDGKTQAVCLGAKMLIAIKVCVKCKRNLPRGSHARVCPYCGGTLRIKYVPKDMRSENEKYVLVAK